MASVLDDDLYAVLGLEAALESSALDVRKAYRKCALEWHPDKRPGDAHAAAQFEKIQKAYEVLGDVEARKAYDELLRVRKAKAEKLSQQSSKRQKMVADLVARETAAEQERNAEEIARERLKKELARIRKKAAEAKESQQRGTAGASAAGRGGMREGAGGGGGGGGAGDEAKTLKVSWLKGEGIGDAYSAERLREIFEEFGQVEDVLVRAGKKKKGVALVVMHSAAAAVAATGNVCGDLANPLLVVPAAPLAGASTESIRTNEPSSRPPEASSEAGNGHTDYGANGAGGFNPGKGAGGGGSGGESGEGKRGGPAGGGRGGGVAEIWSGGPMVGTAYKDYESLTLMRMRQAGERARLIKEMQEQEEREQKKQPV